MWNGAAGSPTLISANTSWEERPVWTFNLQTYTFFHHQDPLGTERLRTYYDGSIAGTYQTLPFGDGFISNCTDADPYHFAQLLHDAESGTEHAQMRQYSSAQGH